MQFSIAVATYDYKFSDLIQPKCILLLFCSQKSHAGLRSSCWQHSSGGSRGEFISLSFPGKDYLHSLAFGSFLHLQSTSLQSLSLHHPIFLAAFDQLITFYHSCCMCVAFCFFLVLLHLLEPSRNVENEWSCLIPHFSSPSG